MNTPITKDEMTHSAATSPLFSGRALHLQHVSTEQVSLANLFFRSLSGRELLPGTHTGVISGSRYELSSAALWIDFDTGDDTTTRLSISERLGETLLQPFVPLATLHALPIEAAKGAVEAALNTQLDLLEQVLGRRISVRDIHFEQPDQSDNRLTLAFALVGPGQHNESVGIELDTCLFDPLHQCLSALDESPACDWWHAVPVTVHFELGRSQLSSEDWRTLSVGDFISFDECYYDRSESIRITLDGGRYLSGKLSGNSIRLDSPAELMTSNAAERGAESAKDAHRIRFTLGAQSLSLGELQSLENSSSFTLDDEPEPLVMILQDRRVVGRGELIELNRQAFGVRVVEWQSL